MEDFTYLPKLSEQKFNELMEFMKIHPLLGKLQGLKH